MDNRREAAPTPDARVRPADGAFDPEARLPDEAVFAIERVPRGRGLRTAGLVLLAIAGLATVGTVANAKRIPATAEIPVPSMTVASTSGPELERGDPRLGDDLAMPWAPAPPLLVLDATFDAGAVFVQGDVYTLGADVVVVALDDVRNRMLDVRRLQMPGGSTAMRTGPNDRFSLQFTAVGAPDRRPTWVTAVALDASGGFVASAIVRVG